MNFLTAIPGYPGYYLNQHGDVFSRWGRGRGAMANMAPRRLKPQYDKDGYCRYTIRAARNRPRPVGLHVLLLLAHVGPPPTAEHVGCHNDGDNRNNALSNLRWDTQTGNQRDRVRHGTDSRGEKQWMAKLSSSDVRGIRLLYAHGEPQVEIAKAFGISTSHTNRILRGHNWTHLPSEVK